MIDAELRRFIEKEIKRQVQVVLTGATESNAALTESIASAYPGMATVPSRPLVLPYGLASRAPEGTISCVLRQGDHPGALLTVGHRDAKRPSVEVGESSLYSKDGYEVRVKNGQIQVGKNGVFETVVVGDTLKTLLSALIDAIVQHTHLGNLGYPTGAPQNAAVFSNLKAENLSNDKILAKNGGRF